MAGLTIHQLPDAGPLDGSEELPLQRGPDTKKTTAQDVANLAVIAVGPPGPAGPAGPPGASVIGMSIGGGVANRALFIDGGGNLGQDVNYQWNGTRFLTNGTPGSGSYAVQAATGNYFAYLAISNAFGVGVAGHFGDGINTVDICNGVDAITYQPSSPGDWAGAAPTDVWVALDRIAAALNILGTPP